ncbi:MAG: hypothetical protein KDN05_02805 [Verrucomicrobiae bacterium]|nr:hypothetical protein [Verrucomicrobiae bacterium]
MSTFRIHIRPSGGLGNPGISFAYCLDEGVLGVGWPTYLDKGASTWEEYEAEASAHHDDLSRVRYLKENVRKGHLIWTRCAAGEYYLAKVLSEWEYLTSAKALDADIVNVVRCKILKVPRIDAVPGKVVACFRPARAIQRIADERMGIYSRQLWNQLSGEEHFPSSQTHGGEVFPFLGSEETEDLIFIYLQTLGWIVVPNSRKADTMSYEFYLIHRESRERAIVQIKTGNTGLNADDWTGRNERVFLFQSNGLYSGREHPSIECISPAEIQAFMVRNRDFLPASTAYWMDHVGLEASSPCPRPTVAETNERRD